MRDYDIRQLLKKTTLKVFKNDPNSKIVEEFGIISAGARIDIAVINGSLHGFEIKSERDTLQRLPSQLVAYTKVFDYLSVITEEKHVDSIFDLIPEWVGIYICSEGKKNNKISEYRAPIKNEFKEGFYLAKLLWREELVSILNHKGIPYNKKDRNWILCEVVSANIEIQELSILVREKLKERKNWKV